MHYPALPTGSQRSAGFGISQTQIFTILGQSVRIRCHDAAVAQAVEANFMAFAAAADGRPAALDYELVPNPQGGHLLWRRGQAPVAAEDLAELLFHLEKDLIITLQMRRPELLYLHAAALEQGGRAFLLAGESGHGKSTTAWGLLHHGFHYLSDELSPVDLDALSVLAYPHAVCMKRRPPAPYPVAEAQLLDLGRTLHVPVAALPSGSAAAPCPLGALFFVRHDPALREPRLRPLPPAEAGARAYVNTLNALAHPGHGLDAVARLVQSVPCWTLDSADLAATCRLMQDFARNLPAA